MDAGTSDIRRGMSVFGTDSQKVGTVAALYGGVPDGTDLGAEIDVTESGNRVRAQDTVIVPPPAVDTMGVLGAPTTSMAGSMYVSDEPVRVSSGPGYLEVEQGGILGIGARHLYIPYAAILNVLPGEAVEVDCTEDECLERFGERPSWLD